MEKSRVLLVDDELETLKFVSANLQARGHEVLTARNGHSALDLFQDEGADLVILDINLPDLDGFQVCQAIRRESSVPIVILSGRGQERDIVRALDLGADDYLTKPFGIAELMARVRVALRHNPSGSDSSRTPLTIHDMTIDFWENKVFLRGNEIELTRLEFDLLAYLALNAGRTITHRALLQNVWGPEYGDETEYLWTYIKRLRHKIEQDPHNPHLILTHAGFGYSLASPS